MPPYLASVLASALAISLLLVAQAGAIPLWLGFVAAGALLVVAVITYARHLRGPRR